MIKKIINKQLFLAVENRGELLFNLSPLFTSRYSEEERKRNQKDFYKTFEVSEKYRLETAKVWELQDGSVHMVRLSRDVDQSNDTE